MEREITKAIRAAFPRLTSWRYALHLAVFCVAAFAFALIAILLTDGDGRWMHI